MEEQRVKYFAKRENIYPQRVWGRYRIIKWVMMVLLLGIYYLAPWIRWDRGSNLPDQAILFDFEKGRGYFFFIEIWPQEVYYLAGILIFAAIALFFVTSLFGRIWCGYACPQTIWVDLFIWVERVFQGRRVERIRLDKSKWNFNKIWRKLATHITWILISVCTGGAWVFYFNDAPELFDQIIHFDLNWDVGGWILGMTISTYLMAGFAREQVCMYMCPYARFQSAMFDKDSLIIAYNQDRGEPRAKHKKGDTWENKGHCVNCQQCVVVCPQGIDIRDGLQMECIACGFCIDACNKIMSKLSLPKGLIGYDTTRNFENRQKGKPELFRIFRMRTVLYLAILALIGFSILFGLLNRSLLDTHVIHDRNPLYVQLSDGKIRNGYEIKVLNKSRDDKVYEINVLGLENSDLRIPMNNSSKDLEVYADSIGHFRVFVTAPKQGSERMEIKFFIRDKMTSDIDEYDSVFVSND